MTPAAPRVEDVLLAVIAASKKVALAAELLRRYSGYSFVS
jgi:hypothetical protein